MDVSDNLLDAELASVVQGVTRMRSLLRFVVHRTWFIVVGDNNCADGLRLVFMPFPALSLNISKNLPKIKAKEVGHVMEAIVNLIQVFNDKCSILLFFCKNTDCKLIPFLFRRKSPPCRS